MTETTENQLFSRAKYTDYKLYDFEYEVDPENHLFNSINATCDYYTEEQFNDSVNLDNHFSLIHFNCRSLHANFTEIHENLKTLKSKFKLIALSETWLDQERGVDFRIDG